jgi:hypothetical protein
MEETSIIVLIHVTGNKTVCGNKQILYYIALKFVPKICINNSYSFNAG